MRSRVRQCVTSIGKAIRDPPNSLGHDLLLSWPHDETIAHLRSRFTVIWMLPCCWGPRTLQPHPASRYAVLRSSCFLDIKSMYAPPPYLSSLPYPLPLCTSTTLPPGLEVNSPLLQSSPPSTPTQHPESPLRTLPSWPTAGGTLPIATKSPRSSRMVPSARERPRRMMAPFAGCP